MYRVSIVIVTNVYQLSQGLGGCIWILEVEASLTLCIV